MQIKTLDSHFNTTRIILFILVVMLGVFPVIQSVSAQTPGGSTITVRAGTTVNVDQDWSNSNSGGNAAYDNSGTLNFGAYTITNTRGEHRIVYTRNGGTTNFNGTTINLADGNSGGPLIFAMEGTAAVNLNSVTMNQLGSYTGVILRAPDNYTSGGVINFSGTNTFSKIAPKNNGNMAGGIRNGSEFNFTGGTTTFDNCELLLQDGGVYTVQDGAELIFKGTTLVPNNTNAANPLFVVKSGGTLRFTEGSKLDLSQIGGRPAIKVEAGGKLVIDASEMSGANGSNDSSYIIAEGGEVEITNNAEIKNNTNTSQSGNLIRVTDGSLKITAGAKVTGNKVSVTNDTPHTDRTQYPTRLGAVIGTDKSDVLIENAVISNNRSDFGGAIFLREAKSAVVSGSSFEENFQDGGYTWSGGAALYAKDTDLVVNDGNTFRKNEAVHGAVIRIVNGSLVVDGANNSFVDNTARWSGGAIHAMDTDVVVKSGTFTNNSTVYYGGAIEHQGGSLTLGSEDAKPVFTANTCGYIGGAVAVEIDITNVTSGFIDMSLTINDAVFEGNHTPTQGGALGIGYSSDTIQYTHAIEAEIIKGTFTGNYVNNCPMEVGGGAIFVSNDGHLKMSKAAFTNNRTQGGGGAIASCPDAETYINIVDGAAIFSNTADLPEADHQDVYVMNKENPFVISEKMFNGGLHQWKMADITAYAQGTWEVRETEGLVFGSAPTNTDISGAMVVFTDNYSEQRKDPSEDLAPYIQYQANGGAIGNNGRLEIGMEGTDILITKVWDVNETVTLPDPVEVLNALVLTADGRPYRLGTFELVSADEESKTYIYNAVGGEDASVFAVVQLNDSGNYVIGLSGLRADVTEWKVSESLAGYDASVEGSAADGFVITNTPKPEEPNEWHFYFFEELPKTGFSALHPTALTDQPKDLRFKSAGLTLQIPSLDVSAEIVTVPYTDGEYPVEWLGADAGMLEGSSKPGEGMTILTGHNTLNSTESGPFAFLSFLEEGDIIFVRDSRGQMKSFKVYASEKIGSSDAAALERIARMDENSLTLLTCEDEMPAGGYASRRVVAARPY